jgi:hypothetical protein
MIQASTNGFGALVDDADQIDQKSQILPFQILRTPSRAFKRCSWWESILLFTGADLGQSNQKSLLKNRPKWGLIHLAKINTQLEKSSPKFCDFKTAHYKQSPHVRKLAQSGHTDLGAYERHTLFLCRHFWRLVYLGQTRCKSKLSSRVTRLGDFSKFEWLFTLGIF